MAQQLRSTGGVRRPILAARSYNENKKIMNLSLNGAVIYQIRRIAGRPAGLRRALRRRRNQDRKDRAFTSVALKTAARQNRHDEILN
jgi:hypothetical protein